MARNVSKSLKEMRKQRKMSRQMIAKVLQIDKETLARFERGESEPRASQILEMAQILNTSVEDVVLSVVSNLERNPRAASARGERRWKRNAANDDS